MYFCTLKDSVHYFVYIFTLGGHCTLHYFVDIVLLVKHTLLCVPLHFRKVNITLCTFVLQEDSVHYFVYIILLVKHTLLCVLLELCVHYFVYFVL